MSCAKIYARRTKHLATEKDSPDHAVNVSGGHPCRASAVGGLIFCPNPSPRPGNGESPELCSIRGFGIRFVICWMNHPIVETPGIEPGSVIPPHSSYDYSRFSACARCTDGSVERSRKYSQNACGSSTPIGPWSLPMSTVFPVAIPRFCCRAAMNRPRAALRLTVALYR